jgi:tRNA pseudouridine55 synthase
LGVSKGGHAGTLDPMASGLLVVALGRCTRLLEYLPLEPKEYEFTVAFGAATDTLDAEGRITARSDVMPTEERLVEAAKIFLGEIEQTPPQYSAVKVGGKPAYKSARSGVSVDIKPRKISIYSLELRRYDADKKQADFAVSCSGGTYVRTLAVDITKAADAGAEGHVCALRRTRAGRFDLSNAVGFSNLPNAKNHFISASDAIDGDKKVIINDKQKANVSKGREIAINDNGLNDILIAFDEHGTLAAVLKKVDGDRYHPDKVFER